VINAKLRTLPKLWLAERDDGRRLRLKLAEAWSENGSEKQDTFDWFLKHKMVNFLLRPAVPKNP